MREREREREGQTHTDRDRERQKHTPIIAFRHPPPKKDIVNQCLEFETETDRQTGRDRQTDRQTPTHRGVTTKQQQVGNDCLLFQLACLCVTRWMDVQRAADGPSLTRDARQATRTKMAARARLTGTGTSNLTKTMRARDLARDPDSELSVCSCLSVLI